MSALSSRYLVITIDIYMFNRFERITKQQIIDRVAQSNLAKLSMIDLATIRSKVKPPPAPPSSNWASKPNSFVKIKAGI
jgi:hypothetical protein